MMRHEMNQSPSQRIHEIVRAIPDGEISATARKGGLSVRYLMKMRGEVVNIGADSLENENGGSGKSLGRDPKPPSARRKELHAENINRPLERARRGRKAPVTPFLFLRQRKFRPSKAETQGFSL